MMRVYLDDAPIGDVAVTAVHDFGSWQEFSFTVDVAEPPKVLRIEFPYDDFDVDTGRDRNLGIGQVAVNGRRLAIEGATYEQHDDVALLGQPGLFRAGSLMFPLAP